MFLSIFFQLIPFNHSIKNIVNEEQNNASKNSSIFKIYYAAFQKIKCRLLKIETLFRNQYLN